MLDEETEAVQIRQRSLKDWLIDVRRGVVRLPRFQRDETWGHTLVGDFIEAVLLKRPLGFFLVLAVNPDKQPFETRPIAGAVNNGEDCREHLLDGQQRLMALWRSFNGTYKGYVFYAKWNEEGGLYNFEQVVSVAKGKTNLQWIGKPESEFIKHCIPISYLGPEQIERAHDWVRKATTDEESKRCLTNLIGKIHSTILSTQLPYLCIPQETDPDDAIDIFIKANTSSVRLNPFDIAVAQFEAATPAKRRHSSQSLRDLVDMAKNRIPEVANLEGEDNLGDLALKIACVKQKMKPTYGNYRKVIPALEHNWNSILRGMKWTAQALGEEHIWDARILPSTVPLRVLSALSPFIPKEGDKRGKARRLVRSYLWRSFVTDWYAKQANDRLLSDFRALKEALENETFTVLPDPSGRPDTVFDRPLPDEEALFMEGWPKRKGILKRAILAVSVIGGARDMETDGKISADNIQSRQYHHIFPDRLLKDHAKDEEPNLALNCMLLEASTNISWRDEWPGDYLMQRVEQSGLKGSKAEKAIKSRLESHHIPSDVIMKAKKSAKADLAKTYQSFLQKRAEMVMAAFRGLCAGEDL